MEERVIKPHMVKPMLEKIVFEKMMPPQPGAMINVKNEDTINVRKVSEEVVKVLVERKLAITPTNIMRVSVTMGIDIPVDSIEFMKLEDPKEYIRNSQPVMILLGYISKMITDITVNTILGPIVTPPMIQE